MPALGNRGSRRVDTGAYSKRQRNLRSAPGPPNFPTAVPKRPGQIVPSRTQGAVVKAWARHPAAKRVSVKPAPRLAPSYRAAPTPAQRSKAIERGYASQGKAVDTAAAEQQILHYLNQPPAQRRSTVKEIKAKKPDQVNRGDYNILRIHGQRQGVDVRQRKETGFLPRVRYGDTPKVTRINVMPTPDRTAKALEQASPKLRAAVVTNPKLKSQLAGMIPGKGVEGALGALKEQKAQRAATVQAPALKLLDIPMRPGYAALEQMRTDIKRGGLGEVLAVHAPGSKAAKERRQAYKRGITAKTRTTGSDVLAQAGVKNPIVKAVGGFGLDIAANPLSFTQGGAGTVAERAAALAARKAVGASVRGGVRRATIAKLRQAGETQARKEVGVVGPLTREQHGAVQKAGERAVTQVQQRARQKAEAAAPQGKGITVRFAGSEIPGVRRGTAAVGRGAGKVIPTPVKRITRTAARTLRPTIRAEGYTTAQFEGGLHASASARAAAQHAEQRALTLAREVKAKVPAEDFPKVIAALERNRLGSLPDEYRGTVHDLRSAFREYYRHGRRSGVIKGEVGDFGNWLKKGDLRRLLKTVEAEPAAQIRGLGQAKIRLQRAGSRVAIAETELAGRQRTGVVRLTEQERRRQDLAHARELGSARLGVARRRGGEAQPPQIVRKLTGQKTYRAQPHKPPEVSKEQYIAERPKPAAGTPEPTVEALTKNVKPGKPGVSIESEHVAQKYRDGEFAGWGRELPGSKVVVARDAQGKPMGALRIVGEGKDTILEVAVDPAHRGKGIATQLAKAAHDAGYDVAGAARAGGLTEAGAGFTHAGLTKLAGEAKPVAIKVRRYRHEPLTAAEQRFAEAKGPKPRVTQQSALRAAEERGQALPPTTSARVEAASARRGEHAQDVETRQARVQAAKDIPVKGASESDKQYLTRLRDHARQHDLPLLEQRATRELEAKPAMTRGYFPREFDTRIQRRFGLFKPEARGRATGEPISQLKVSRVTAGHKRAEQRPLAVVNPERVEKGQEPHSTDLPSVTLNHIRDLGKSTSQAEWAAKMGDLGRAYKEPTLRPRETLEQLDARRAKAADEFSAPKTDENPAGLHADEQLYFLGTKDGKYDLHPVSKVEAKATKTRTSKQAQKKDPGWAARQALKPTKGRAAGRYVVLNRQLVDELHGLAAPVGSNQYDQALGKWKSLAIGSPAFHIRNLIGDLHTASYEQPLLNILGRTGPQAAKAIRRESALGRVVRPSEAATPRTKFQRLMSALGAGVPDANATIKIAGQRKPLDQFLKEAREDGMLDVGRVAGEFRQLAGSERDVQAGASSLGITKPRQAARAMTRWSINRENMMRLATYKGMLDKGYTRAEASRIANELHIDYAHLSQFERAAMRRVFPFYTWTARTLPLTAKKLVTRPGKFAAFESLAQESAKAAGLTPEQARSKMSVATQRQLPLTVKVPGLKDPVALSWSDPMGLLGSLPSGKDFPAEAKRLAVSMLTPGAKVPGELLFSGKNWTTGADIEGRHLATAPAEIGQALERGLIPAAVQRELKILPPRGSIPGKPNVGYVDFKTGKPAWGWRGRADYVHDQALLGLGGQVAGVLGAGRSPAQSKGPLIAGLAGLRADVLDPKTAKYAQQATLRKERDKLYKRRDDLGEGGIDAAHPNPELKRIQKRLNELNKTLSPRAKKPGDFKIGGGGGGGGFKIGAGGGGGFKIGG